jgi:signal transduction histidine kinase
MLPEMQPGSERTAPVDIERNIARCRIVLSLLALAAVYLDPTKPTLIRWLPLTGGRFHLDPYTLAVMLSHLGYSLALYYALVRGLGRKAMLVDLSMWLDVLFGAAIAVVTEGATSPFYVFFAFAVLTVGLRRGLRTTLFVTAASVGLYLSLIAVSGSHTANIYIMRPAYLGITGYLVGYLGQQRLVLEAQVRDLEATAQRQRIARSLHDGYAQVLAGVSLRLETGKELMRRGRSTDAFAELSDLQESLNREYDELRAYIRSLAEVDMTPEPTTLPQNTHVSVEARFDGSRVMVEHSLQIMVEAVRNIGRHARARTATIAATTEGPSVRIAIDDDGVGLPSGASAPWSIASRVAECGGTVHLPADVGGGAHLLIELPQA